MHYTYSMLIAWLLCYMQHAGYLRINEIDILVIIVHIAA